MGTALAQALVQAGLSHYIPVFQTLSSEQFIALTLHQLSSLGISNVADKQALHGVAMRLAKAPKAPHTAQAALELGLQDELIDLEAHDGGAGHLDLLSHACGPTFQLSPMGQERASNSRPSGGVPGQQASAKAVAADREPLLAEEHADPPKIRVVVRKRPINKKEREGGQEDIVDCYMSRSCIVVNEPKLKVDLTKYIEKHQFNFDEALDESVTNDQVYSTTVQPLVHTLFRNGRASCFAYGQTGSGKTYTMSPLPIRASADIMRYLALKEFRDVRLWVSCFEIYGNKVFDLLNQRKRLNILEDGKKQVCVVGLREVAVQDTDTVKQLIEEANRQRSVGSTAANSDSSRSHSIMQFALKRDGEDGKLIGKISFIDLAGSERGADTYDNNRQTRLEGAEINKSLLALKECIRALDSDARHVPFRGSKLTAVLRDSFLGDQARTVMIANISPNSTSVEHTLNTLRYADRVKELRKDKAERAPGGVTPGEDPAYYAAVQRAHQVDGPPAAGTAGALSSRDRSPVKGPQQRPRTPSKPVDHINRPSDVGVAAIPVGGRVSGVSAGGGRIDHSGSSSELLGAGLGDEDEQLRQNLMNTILEEEEQLILAHRAQIEENMDAVRKEMTLLTEVDMPGSAIDQYVEKLDAMLQYKLGLIMQLKAKLDRFKEQLNQEEIMSKSIPPSTSKRY